MRNKVARLDVNRENLIVDDTEYKITPGLDALIMLKHPRPEWKPNDYKVYKLLVAQTKVKSFPNRRCSTTHYMEMEVHVQADGYTWRKDNRRMI